MARYRNVVWNLGEGTPCAGGGFTLDVGMIQAAVLMDIRDELQRLNTLLHCENFQAIPSVLREIRRRLPERPKPRKLKRVA